jgi:hypothetical protein
MLDICLMVSILGTTNEATHTLKEPFIFPSYKNVGPPYITTLRLLGLTIGLLVWFFPTLVIPNATSASIVSTSPKEHQPHVDPSPSSPVISSSPSSLPRSCFISSSSPSEISKASNLVNNNKKKRNIKKNKNKQGSKLPTTARHVGEQPVTVNHAGSVDDAKITQTTRKPKYPCKLCKGNHFMMDFHSLHKVLEMCSSMSSAPVGNYGDTLSTSDIMVGKKKRTVKFPFLLCEGDNYSQLFPCMDEASYILENFQLPASDHEISSNPLLIDGLVNLVPSLISLVDQVIILVSSSVQPLTQVADLVPSSVSPTLHLKSKTKVVDLVSSSINPTLHLKSSKVVDSVLSSINPTHPLKSVTKVVDSVP